MTSKSGGAGKSVCLFLLVFCLMVIGRGGVVAEATPVPGKVENAAVLPAPPAAQPLLGNVARLVEALEFLGQPLPAEVRARLAQAAAAPDDATVARLVQEALDPVCLAAVEIPVSGAITVTPNTTRPPLVEQGWQTYLVKVINNAGITNPLRIYSPNARPVPGGPASQIKSRWLDIAPFHHRPLNANLSGLGLEYQVVQLYCRDAGERSATIAFDAGTGDTAGARTNPDAAKPSSAHSWRFAKDTNGWGQPNNATITTNAGRLVVRAGGGTRF